MKLFRDNTPQIVPFSNISHITKQVSEQIKKKHLHSFIKTAILQSNMTLNNSTVSHFVFIQKTNTYEIYTFSKKNKNAILEMQFLENYYSLQNIEPLGYDLFVCEEFFALLSDGKFLLFRENKKYEMQDIEKFVKFAYDIEIKNIFEITKERFQILKSDFENIKSLKYLHPDKKYNIFYFLIYTILISYFFVYLYEQNKVQPKTNDKIDKQIPQQTLNNNKNISPILVTFLKNIELSGVGVRKLHYDTAFDIEVVGNNDAIYKFIRNYGKELNVVKMEKLDDNTSIAEITIE